MGSGGKLSRQTPGLLIGHIVPSNPWAAGWLPAERDAGRVQGGEADVGGRDDHGFGWKRQTSR